MPVSSMTGIGEAEGEADGISWRFDVRSVNGKGLELRLRLPSGADSLEPSIREKARAQLKRGSVTIALQIQRATEVSPATINMEALDVAITGLKTIAERIGQTFDPSKIDTLSLMSTRGVLESSDDTEPLSDTTKSSMLFTLEAAIGALRGNRMAEGARLAVVLAAQIDEIETLIDAAVASAARSPDAIQERLNQQVARLADTESIDPDRLHQEALVLAAKADIQEELDRLVAHVELARSLLASDEPIGRRFDFLAQEFNREANTLCSKSNDKEVTRIGMGLKTVIDQLREQVQNIE